MHEGAACGHGDGVMQRMFAPARLEHGVHVGLPYRVRVGHQLSYVPQQHLEPCVHCRLLRILQQLLDHPLRDAPCIGHLGMGDVHEFASGDRASVSKDQFSLALAQRRWPVHQGFAHGGPRFVDLGILGVDARRAGVGGQRCEKGHGTGTPWRGGQSDAKDRRIPVEVFCVRRSRWRYSSKTMYSRPIVIGESLIVFWNRQPPCAEAMRPRKEP